MPRRGRAASASASNGCRSRWRTPLAKELTGGHDLSGGEWQRLALARAFYRSEAALVVLDEPTYGVDPAAEGDIWVARARPGSPAARR